MSFVSLKPGDHLRVRRLLYDHHGIYVGNGAVVHYADPDGGKTNPSVRCDTLERFAIGDQIEVVPHANSLPSWIVVQRALGLVGRKNYSMTAENCEHIATWSKSGVATSFQVAAGIAIGACVLMGVLLFAD